MTSIHLTIVSICNISLKLLRQYVCGRLSPVCDKNKIREGHLKTENIDRRIKNGKNSEQNERLEI